MIKFKSEKKRPSSLCSFLRWKTIKEKPPLNLQILLIAGHSIFMGSRKFKNRYADNQNYEIHGVVLWAMLPDIKKIMARLDRAKSNHP